MGELIIQVETIKGLLIAAEHRSSPGNDNIWLPEELPLQMARNLGTVFTLARSKSCGKSAVTRFYRVPQSWRILTGLSVIYCASIIKARIAAP